MHTDGHRCNNFFFQKFITFLIVLMLSFVVAFPAYAAKCRNYNNHQVCILSITRSAKNYWEYRASVSVDGIKTPIEVYNCRQRFKVQKDGKIVPFKDTISGELVCSLFKQ